MIDLLTICYAYFQTINILATLTLYERSVSVARIRLTKTLLLWAFYLSLAT